MKKTNRHLRLAIHLVFFVVIGILTVNNTLIEQDKGWGFIPEASLHSLCPFGGVVSIYNLLTLGSFVQKIHQSSLILAGLVLVLSLLFGAVICGWACPFGTIQELFGKLGRKLIGKRYNKLVPMSIDKYLRYLRYGVLTWVIYATATSAKLIFEEYDPYAALFSFWSEEVAIPGLIILIAVLFLSLLIERPWCKYACPYGALLGVFNRIRLFKIVRQESTCVSCSKCDNNCPMNIKVSKSKSVVDVQCITCLQCTSDNYCPVSDTVELTTKGRSESNEG
jgi:polyferredoxin